MPLALPENDPPLPEPPLSAPRGKEGQLLQAGMLLATIERLFREIDPVIIQMVIDDPQPDFLYAEHLKLLLEFRAKLFARVKKTPP